MTAEIASESVPEAAADQAIQAASDRRKLVLVVILLIGLGIAIVTQPKKPELTQALIDSTEGQATVSAADDGTDDRESPSSVATYQQDSVADRGAFSNRLGRHPVHRAVRGRTRRPSPTDRDQSDSTRSRDLRGRRSTLRIARRRDHPRWAAAA